MFHSETEIYYSLANACYEIQVSTSVKNKALFLFHHTLLRITQCRFSQQHDTDDRKQGERPGE